jgi:hypothetical protein
MQRAQVFDVIKARNNGYDYFKDISVFLDEFFNDDRAVLIRNLCRALSMCHAISINCLVCV